jgi:cytochrome P450
VIELQEDPRVLERLRRELERGDEYLDAMIRQSLRLHPIVPTVTRLLRVQRLVSVLLKV